MKGRGYITICLAVLIGGAQFHCLAHAGEDARHHLHLLELKSKAVNESLPARPSPPCENESGCICRGAVLADHIDAAPLAPRLGEFLADARAPLAIGQVDLEPVAGGYLRGAHAPAPLSGRILRARLASFLI